MTMLIFLALKTYKEKSINFINLMVLSLNKKGQDKNFKT